MARACPNRSKQSKGKGQEEHTIKACQAKIKEVIDDREDEKEIAESSKGAPPRYDNEEEMVTAVWWMMASKRDEFLERLAVKDF